MFKILCSLADLGFIISREKFNNLMTIILYFIVPTDHMQKLQISTKIKCSDVAFECNPTIDQKYLYFKAVELDSYQFVSYSVLRCKHSLILKVIFSVWK